MGYIGWILSAIMLGWAGSRTAAMLFERTYERLIAAPVICFGAVIVLAESLSLAQSLNQPVLWLLGSLLFVAVGGLTRLRVKTRPASGEFREEMKWEWLRPWPVRLVIGVYAGLLVVALWVPPNSADGLAYHLSRTAHYLQQGSFNYFQSPDVRQTGFPINAEAVMLWTFAFIKSDRLAVLVPFVSAIFAALTVAGIALRLALPRSLAVLAAILVLGFPQIAVQSTSTLVDIVAAWLSVAAVFFILGFAITGNTSEALLAAMAIGLAAGTKPTTWFLAPGLVLFYLACAWRNRTLSSSNVLGLAGVVALGLMLFTMPHLIRNYRSIGTFILPFPTVWVMFPSAKTVLANSVRLASDFIDTNDLPYPLNMSADFFKREIQLRVLDVRWLNSPESTLELTYFGFDASDISERFAGFGVAGFAMVAGTAACVLHAIFVSRVAISKRVPWVAFAAMPAGYVAAHIIFLRWQPGARFFCSTMLLTIPPGLKGLALVSRLLSRRFRRICWSILAWLPVGGCVMTLLLNESKPLVPRAAAPAIWQMSPMEQKWLEAKFNLPVAKFMADRPPQRIGVCGGVGGLDYAAFGPQFRNTVTRYTKPLDWAKLFRKDKCDTVLVYRPYYHDIPPSLHVEQISDYWSVVTVPPGGLSELRE